MLRLDRDRDSELADILDNRLEHGMIPVRVTGEAIAYIASLDSGNARRAIGLFGKSHSTESRTASIS